MAMRAGINNEHHLELTHEQYWARFDGEARRRLGMSGEEFITQYEAGAIDVDDPTIHDAAVELEMMLPIVRAARIRQ